MSLTVYTHKDCLANCGPVVDHLISKGIPIKVIDLADNEPTHNIGGDSKNLQVPAVCINDLKLKKKHKCVIGFDKPEIDKLIKLSKK